MTASESIFTFPCEFPIKIMGLAGDEFEIAALEIVHRHAELKESAIKMRPSKDGKYLALSVTITAQSQAQLDSIYQELTDCPYVLVAL